MVTISNEYLMECVSAIYGSLSFMDYLPRHPIIKDYPPPNPRLSMSSLWSMRLWYEELYKDETILRWYIDNYVFRIILTHWSWGGMVDETYSRKWYWISHVILLSSDWGCHRIPLINHYWFRLGAVRHQAITLANVDQVPPIWICFLTVHWALLE